MAALLLLDNEEEDEDDDEEDGTAVESSAGVMNNGMEFFCSYRRFRRRSSDCNCGRVRRQERTRGERAPRVVDLDTLLVPRHSTMRH